MATGTGQRRPPSTTLGGRSGVEPIVVQLDAIERGGGDGTLDFGRGRTLRVSSLDKVFFPEAGYTKGDVMRYYAAIADVVLPIIRDRPLILKRYPDGIAGPSFFQQNAGNQLPAGVRTESIGTADAGRADRLVGGDLVTLLYAVQVGTIAVHTWQTRVGRSDYADTTTIDLDPGHDVPFTDVIALARQIKLLLDRWQLRGALKTSGASGLHIVLPLPTRTSFDRASALADHIASTIVDEQPERATVERSIKARPAGTIYVDAQQNSRGKSVVSAYSVRERAGAPVSAPLAWRELRASLRLDRFTIRTMPARIRKLGDLWGDALRQRNTAQMIDRVLRGA